MEDFTHSQWKKFPIPNGKSCFRILYSSFSRISILVSCIWLPRCLRPKFPHK